MAAAYNKGRPPAGNAAFRGTDNAAVTVVGPTEPAWDGTKPMPLTCPA